MIYSFIISIDITSFSPYAVHFSLLINRIHYQIFIYPPESQVKIDTQQFLFPFILLRKRERKVEHLFSCLKAVNIIWIAEISFKCCQTVYKNQNSTLFTCIKIYKFTNTFKKQKLLIIYAKHLAPKQTKSSTFGILEIVSSFTCHCF